MSRLRTQPYKHPELGFTIVLPAGSEIAAPEPGVALAAYDVGVEEGDFATNLVVTVHPVDPAVDLGAFVDASLAEQGERLVGFQLLDRVDDDLGGPAVRTLAHHDHGGWAVTIEQWWLLAGGRGYTVTASADTLDWDAVADALDDAARSFSP